MVDITTKLVRTRTAGQLYEEIFLLIVYTLFTSLNDRKRQKNNSSLTIASRLKLFFCKLLFRGDHNYEGSENTTLFI